MAAAAAADMDSVRLLLDRGADVNAQTEPGFDRFFLGRLADAADVGRVPRKRNLAQAPAGARGKGQ